MNLKEFDIVTEGIGDDLEAYMYKKGVSIAHLSPLKRIKLQMTGLKKGREY